ncbi:MAG: hypothetical protein JST00_37065 [Deltaproteobacteria bacterium]|nr:hypothetical protein [Deltaproteobacteria bacterium]
MSLVLAGLIVAGASGAAIVGRWLAKRKNADEASADAKDAKDPKDAKDGEGETDERSRAEAEEAAGRSSEDPHEPSRDPDADGGRRPGERKPKEKEKPKKARKIEGPMAHLEGFPCQLGDVIMRMTGEEAWLAGGLVLSEDVPVAALFVAPDAGHDCAVYVRPSPRTSLYWLEPLDPKAVLVGGEPPTSVEHGGIRFDRARRLPLRPKRIGVGAPDAGDALVVAEYHSAGAERLLVMKSSAGSTHAYRGVELEASTYEVIASGRSTLDEA